jgi:hypothetical protein
MNSRTGLCESKRCARIGDADHLPFRYLNLSGHDDFVRALDFGRASAHQLRRTETGHDDELEGAEFGRALYHGSLFVCSARFIELVRAQTFVKPSVHVLW